GMMNVRNVALFSSWCLLGAVYIWQPNFSVLFIWTCITMAYVFAVYVRYGIMRTVRLMRSEAKLPNTSLEIRLKMRHKLWFDSVLHSNYTVKEYWKTSTGEKTVCVFKCKFGTSKFDFTYDFR